MIWIREMLQKHNMFQNSTSAQSASLLQNSEMF